jgi:hypothetical protein
VAGCIKGQFRQEEGITIRAVDGENPSDSVSLLCDEGADLRAEQALARAGDSRDNRADDPGPLSTPLMINVRDELVERHEPIKALVLADVDRTRR